MNGGNSTSNKAKQQQKHACRPAPPDYCAANLWEKAFSSYLFPRPAETPLVWDTVQEVVYVAGFILIHQDIFKTCLKLNFAKTLVSAFQLTVEEEVCFG